MSLGCTDPYYPMPDPLFRQVPWVSEPGLWRCAQTELPRVKGCGPHCCLSPRRCGGKCLINNSWSLLFRRCPENRARQALIPPSTQLQQLFPSSPWTVHGSPRAGRRKSENARLSSDTGRGSERHSGGRLTAGSLPFEFHSLKILWPSSKSWMKNHQMTQQSHCSVYTQRNRKQGLKQILEHAMFKAASFTRAKRWKHPKGPSTDERIHKMGPIHIMDYYPALKSNNNISEPRERDKYPMIPLTRSTYNRQMERQKD